QGETRRHPWLQDEAHRFGIGGFRRQVRVAAQQAVVLVRVIRADVTVLRSRHTRESALRCGVSRGKNTRRRVDGACAVVVRAVQQDGLREEQLQNVWGTHGTLEAGARAQVPYRCPLESQLVGVGIEAQAVV